MNRLHPCLWFDDKAEDAANFYVSIFENSKIDKIARYNEEGAKGAGRPQGSVMTVTFELDGQEFMALNGGPHFKFGEAVSFVINCKNQNEVDRYWSALSAGGSESQCGWLKDKYGLSWQIVPEILGRYMTDKDPVKSKRVMAAMLKMKKLDIPTLQHAYAQ